MQREISTVSKSQAMGAGTKSDRERKIGHRRVDEAGQVTYKKVSPICHVALNNMFEYLPSFSQLRHTAAEHLVIYVVPCLIFPFNYYLCPVNCHCFPKDDVVPLQSRNKSAQNLVTQNHDQTPLCGSL